MERDIHIATLFSLTKRGYLDRWLKLEKCPTISFLTFLPFPESHYFPGDFGISSFLMRTAHKPLFINFYTLLPPIAPSPPLQRCPFLCLIGLTSCQ